MPNSPSAIKRLKQSKKLRLHNRITKKLIKTYGKRALTALADKKVDQAAGDLKMTMSKIDKAGARRVLHPNTAGRRKSRLAREYAAAFTKAKASA